MSDEPWPSDRPSQAHQPSFRMSNRQLGMVVFLASLTVLFVGSIVAYAITRHTQSLWRTTELPGLPPGLLASTLLLVGVSVAQRRALRFVRANRFGSMKTALWISGALATAFLVGQTFNWIEMIQAELAASVQTLYVFTFVMLTGLHALHVIGGLVPLGFVIHNANRREYSSSRHEGLRLCVQYWDFLLVVWLVLLVTLWFGSQ